MVFSLVSTARAFIHILQIIYQPQEFADFLLLFAYFTLLQKHFLLKEEYSAPNRNE
jgi:hypothetical protein